MIRYSILIPVYNAEKSLPILLDKINHIDKKPEKIYVVDDGSCDSTSEMIEKFPVHGIKLEKNKGKGYALRVGFNKFLDSGDSEYLICMDADLQHPVDFIDNFLASINGGPQLLIGKRNRRLNQMPFLRILSNMITSVILTRITGQTIEDSQCGFRLVDRNTLKRLELKEDGFQLESEMIIEAAKLDIPIRFINIPTIYNGNISNINHIGDTYRFIKLIMKQVVSSR
jgi:glycosyltransferase involved in cell wall biosynthesis